MHAVQLQRPGWGQDRHLLLQNLRSTGARPTAAALPAKVERPGRRGFSDCEVAALDKTWRQVARGHVRPRGRLGLGEYLVLAIKLTARESIL